MPNKLVKQKSSDSSVTSQNIKAGGERQEKNNSKVNWNFVLENSEIDEKIISGGKLSKKIYVLSVIEMKEQLQRYMEYLCGEYTNKTTIKNNFNVVKRFYLFVSGVLSIESVQKWKHHINETKEHNTINVSFSAVNKFLLWKGREDLRMKCIGQKDTDKETLTEQEILQLIEQAKKNPETHLIVLLLFHALRPNEIINIKFSNIKGDTLYLKDTKTGDNHTILTEEIARAIERYRRVRPQPKQENEDYIFICNHSKQKGEPFGTTLPIQKRIQKVAKESGICKNVTPYMIRRTSATLRLDINSKFYAGDVKLVQRLFRHRDPKTTLRYDHKTDDDLRKYLQKTEKDLIETGKDLTSKKDSKEGLIP